MNFSIQDLLLIIIVMGFHFVFDFVLQSDEDSKNKYWSLHHLNNHVTTYALGLLLCSAVLRACGYFDDAVQAFLWFLCNAGFHWSTDYVTSRINHHYISKNEIHNFFVSVGADQYIHYTTLFTTYLFVLQ